MSKYTLYFERFIGRSLTRHERNIITSLEYVRRHGLDRRVYVVDPPGYDSRKLLGAYYNYLHHCVDPDGAFLVMAKTKRDAAAFSGNLSKPRSPWLTTASNRKFDGIQGKTFNYALVLDANAYNTNAPKRQKFQNKTINHHRHHTDIIDSSDLDAADHFILKQGENYFIIVHIRKGQFNIVGQLQLLPIYIRIQSVPILRVWQEHLVHKDNLLTLNASPPNAPPTLHSL